MERSFLDGYGHRVPDFMSGYLDNGANQYNPWATGSMQDTLTLGLAAEMQQEMPGEVFVGPNIDNGGFPRAGASQLDFLPAPSAVTGGGDVEMAFAGSFAEEGFFANLSGAVNAGLQPPTIPPFFNLDDRNALPRSSRAPEPIAPLGDSIDFNPGWFYNSSISNGPGASDVNEHDIQFSFASGSGTYSGGRDTQSYGFLPTGFNTFPPAPIHDNGLLPNNLTPNASFDVPSGMLYDDVPAQPMHANMHPFFPPSFGPGNNAIPLGESFHTATTVSAPRPLRPFPATLGTSTSSTGSPLTPEYTLTRRRTFNQLPPYARPEEFTASPHYRSDYSSRSDGRAPLGFRSSYIPEGRSTARRKVRAVRAEAEAEARRAAPARLTSYVPTSSAEPVTAAGDSNDTAAVTTSGSSDLVAGAATEIPTVAMESFTNTFLVQPQPVPAFSEPTAVVHSDAPSVVPTNPQPVVAAAQRSFRPAPKLPDLTLKRRFKDAHSGQWIERGENGAIFRPSTRTIPDAPEDTRLVRVAITTKELVDEQYSNLYAAETRAAMEPLPPRHSCNLLFDRRMLMSLELDQLKQQLQEWFMRFPQAKGPAKGTNSYSKAAYRTLFASRAILFDVLDRWEKEDGALTFPPQGWKFRDDFGYETNKRYLGTRSLKAKEERAERMRQAAQSSMPRRTKYYLKPPPV